MPASRERITETTDANVGRIRVGQHWVVQVRAGQPEVNRRIRSIWVNNSGSKSVTLSAPVPTGGDAGEDDGSTYPVRQLNFRHLLSEGE